VRIVSLLPSATELLFAVGAGPEVVGVTHECDHPEPARLLPALTSDATADAGLSAAEIDRHIRHALHQGSSIYALREDLLAALQPDLIVTQELCAVCAVAYDEVERAVRRLPGEVPVLSLEPSSLDDIVETAGSVGRATGHPAGAQQLMTAMRARIAAVRDLPRPQPPPRVACVEWTDPVMAGGHWVPEMVRVAGGLDPLGREGERSAEVTWQAVLDARPEVMVLMPCGFGLDRSLQLAADLTSREGFAALPCATSGRIAAVDGSSYFNRPGPRIVDGLEILARILRTPVGESLGAGAAWVGVPELSGPAWPPS
jgi:iron complex transport system substrate-binding protein